MNHSEGYVSPAMSEALRRETAGEAVSWAGMPNAGAAARKAMLIWLFAIPWSAISFPLFGVAFWSLIQALMGKPLSLKGSPQSVWELTAATLFTLPFVLIGLGLLASPLFVLMTARRTIFGLTTKRLVIITDGRRRSVKSIPLETIGTTVLTEWDNGFGSLKLSTGSRRDSDGDRVEVTEALVGVPDVRRLEKLIRSFQERRSAERDRN